MPRNIQIVYSGLIVTLVNPARDQIVLGVLREHPDGHELKLGLTKSVGGGPPVAVPFKLAPDLRLVVTNGDGVKLVGEKVAVDRTNRLNNVESVKWMVDFDHPPEFYARPVGASAAGFSHLFWINDGQLSTDYVSRTFLFVKRGSGKPYMPFGHVATRLRIDIDLSDASRSAVFTSGGVEVFRAEPNTTYEFSVVHEGDDHGAIIQDANYYYTALGTKIPEKDRIKFLSVDETKLFKFISLAHLTPEAQETFARLLDEFKLYRPPAGPEAACFPPTSGGSYPPT